MIDIPLQEPVNRHQGYLHKTTGGMVFHIFRHRPKNWRDSARWSIEATIRGEVFKSYARKLSDARTLAEGVSAGFELGNV